MRTRLAFPRLPLALGALALAASLSACASSSLQLTEIQSSSDEPSNVAVYFKVMSGDKPVGGLTADQFVIYEDDKPVSVTESKQTILNPEVAASHYTLLLVDMSGSVAESDDRELVAQAATLFTTKVGEVNNEVAVYAFDGEEELHPISKFKKAQGDAGASKLSSYSPKDTSTNLNGAIIAGIELLDTELENADNPLRFGTLVVFTDGTDRASRVSDEEMRSAVKETDYQVFAIGLGSEMSEDDLKKIGKDGTAMATDANSVEAAFNQIATRIEALSKSYYLLSYCSPARAGEHEVKIEAVLEEKDDKGKNKTRKGSLSSNFDAEGFGPGCDPNQKPKFDITKGDTLRVENEQAE